MPLKSRWLLSQCHRALKKQKAKSNIQKANTNRRRRWWLFINFGHAGAVDKGDGVRPEGAGGVSTYSYYSSKVLPSQCSHVILAKTHASPVPLGVWVRDCECVCVCLPKSAEVCSQVNNLLSAHNQRDSRNTHSHTLKLTPTKRKVDGGQWVT